MIFTNTRACEKSQALFFFCKFVKFSFSFMEVEGILEDDTMKARYVIGKKLLGTVPFMKAGSAAICLVAATMEAYVAYIKLQKARECLDSDKTKGNK